MVETLIIGFIWCQIITHYGVSIGLHRYFSHNQFKVHPIHEYFMLFMIMIACVRTPIGWIASHRMHHAYSETERDPHAYQHIGYWKVLLTIWDLKHIPVGFARDLYNNPRLVWCHKHWFHFIVVWWIGTFLISPYLFIGAALMPFILAKVGFGLLNIVGHWNGPTNQWWMNWILGGDGFHKSHHEDNKRIRLHKWDAGGWIAERIFKTK